MAEGDAMVLFPFITGFIHDRMGTYLYPMMLFVLQDSVCALLVSHSHSLPAEGDASSCNSEGSSPLSADHSSLATSLAVAAGRASCV